MKNIKNLDEELVNFINEYLPDMNWEGSDTSAAADLVLDEYDMIEYELSLAIANAILATEGDEFTLSIRPRDNKLILYYID